MTLLEAGWNANHQKALLRTLRNKGALAAAPLPRKIELARFFVGPQLRVSCSLLPCSSSSSSRRRCCCCGACPHLHLHRSLCLCASSPTWRLRVCTCVQGYGLTYVLQLTRLRTGLHKHGKEGLLCLLESCIAGEYDKVRLPGCRAIGQRCPALSFCPWPGILWQPTLPLPLPHLFAWRRSCWRWAAAPRWLPSCAAACTCRGTTCSGWQTSRWAWLLEGRELGGRLGAQPEDGGRRLVSCSLTPPYAPRLCRPRTPRWGPLPWPTRTQRSSTPRCRRQVSGLWEAARGMRAMQWRAASQHA